MASPDRRPHSDAMRLIAAGGALAFLLSGCVGTPAVKIYDLGRIQTAVQPVGGAPVIAVGEPFVLQILDTDRMLVRGADGEMTAIPGVQWIDRMPAMIQARMIAALEAKGRPAIRTGSGVAPDFIVSSELAAFQVNATETPEVDVQIAIKLVQAVDGKIVGARTFRGRQIIDAIDGVNVRAGFDMVLTTLTDDIARWTTSIR